MMISGDLMVIIGAALRAGAAIGAIADAGIVARAKTDGSPVCAADEVGEAIIVDELCSAWPEACIVGEEMISRGHKPGIRPRMVLVDALDGTRELVAGRPEYTVNIGVVENGTPVMGVVYQPATGMLYAGQSGAGAFEVQAATLNPDDADTLASRAIPIAGVKRPKERGAWRALVSRSHADARTAALIEANEIGIQIEAGSSLKFCRLAEGQADIYPRLSPINAWDIAAGHAVLTAAGGHMTTPDGAPYRYNFGTNGFSCPPFVAWASEPEVLCGVSSI
jgi:3'(2'), 5'-bisphosphate nucleotidase